MDCEQSEASSGRKLPFDDYLLQWLITITIFLIFIKLFIKICFASVVALKKKKKNHFSRSPTLFLFTYFCLFLLILFKFSSKRCIKEKTKKLCHLKPGAEITKKQHIHANFLFLV